MYYCQCCEVFMNSVTGSQGREGRNPQCEFRADVLACFFPLCGWKVALIVCLCGQKINKKLIRRWDSERELSLLRNCTRSKNTTDSCINSATDRFLQHRFTKFREITQCNVHYAVQGHSRSPISVPIESSYTTSY